MLALAAGGKFSLTQSWPTASPSARSVMLVHCFQRGVGSFWPGERFAEEVEVFVEEGLGQVRGRAVHRVPAEVGLPCVDGLFVDEVVESLEEVGSGDVEGVERADLDVLEVDREIEVRASSFWKSATV